MMWPQLQSIAPIAVGHILNSLPEGLLIALFAWMMLRLLPRQNSGTRFAVWFAALVSVAVLPFMRTSAAGGSLASGGLVRSAINLPSRWGILLFLIWIAAATVSIVHLASGLWRLRKLRKSCVAIDTAALDPAIRKIIADFSASRSAKLVTSGRVTVPSAIGFFRPMIIIPAWALRELAPEELSVILLHEFAHLRRWDDWTNLLQKVVRAVLFFHPAVWWIEKRLSLEREMACDDLVLAETANPRGYAECLIGLLEKSSARRGLAMAQAAVDRVHEASLRLAQILDAGRPNTKKVWKPALACVSAFFVVCVGTVARAPQFVSFDQKPQTARSESTNSPALSRLNVPVAMVIPAAFHTSSASPNKLSTVTHLNDAGNPRRLAATRRAVHQEDFPQSGPHVIPALANTTHRQVQAVAAREPVQAIPTETLLVVRTAQQTGPDSWTWSVSVWRVVWKNPAQDAGEKAPVAHKT